MHCNLSCLMQCPWLCDTYICRESCKLYLAFLSLGPVVLNTIAMIPMGGGGGVAERIGNLAGRFYMSN